MYMHAESSFNNWYYFRIDLVYLLQFLLFT